MKEKLSRAWVERVVMLRLLRKSSCSLLNADEKRGLTIHSIGVVMACISSFFYRPIPAGGKSLSLFGSGIRPEIS